MTRWQLISHPNSQSTFLPFIQDLAKPFYGWALPHITSCSSIRLYPKSYQTSSDRMVNWRGSIFAVYYVSMDTHLVWTFSTAVHLRTVTIELSFQTSSLDYMKTSSTSNVSTTITHFVNVFTGVMSTPFILEQKQPIIIVKRESKYYNILGSILQ